MLAEGNHMDVHESRPIREEGVHRMDANPCACESSRSQLSHAQGFISISLTVAPEYSFKNVKNLKFLKKTPEITSFSCTQLKGVHRAASYSCALETESTRTQLKNG